MAKLVSLWEGWGRKEGGGRSKRENIKEPDNFQRVLISIQILGLQQLETVNI